MTAEHFDDVDEIDDFDDYRDPPPDRLQYVAMYSFVFQNPNWFFNLLFVTLCQFFIPVVGPIVALGYQFEIVDALYRDRREPYPDFDFDHFGDYLKRGIWPFLVVLVMMFAIAPIMVAAFVLMLLGLQGMDLGPNPPPELVLPVVAVPLLICLLTMVAFTLVITPMTLRAALSQGFLVAFDLTFVRDYLGRVWRELLLGMGFIMLTGPFVAMTGVIACFVGVYVTGTLLVFAQAHFQYQLYELYLGRGGLPVPRPAEDDGDY